MYWCPPYSEIKIIESVRSWWFYSEPLLDSSLYLRDYLLMLEVEITHEPVALYKILKFEGVVASGGEAKSAIDSGLVSVNGVIETRRRKKIIAGDVIEYMDEKMTIVLV
jgi:ribosome-associated protein